MASIFVAKKGRPAKPGALRAMSYYDCWKVQSPRSAPFVAMTCLYQ